MASTVSPGDYCLIQIEREIWPVVIITEAMVITTEDSAAKRPLSVPVLAIGKDKMSVTSSVLVRRC
jgi:hypothetical protein